MQHSYPIKVKEVRRETLDCVSISFDIPDDLKEIFKFKAGQYINIIKTVRGEELHRSYSLCVSPLEKDYRVAVKRVEGGSFSNYANTELKAGELLELMPPNGRFTLNLNENHQKTYLFIATGSGITPILSLVTNILEVEKSSKICLLYGNSSSDKIIFLNQILNLKNLYLDRLQLNFILSQELVEEECFQGRINAQKLKSFDGKIIHLSDVDEVFICGPESMILDIKSSLIESGFSESKIHFELFGTEIKQSLKPLTAKEIGKHAKIKLKTDGRTAEFDLEYGSISILEAALNRKINLPFACKGGVCCTCKARLIEGEVEMLKNYGLEQDEIKAGYILTCQAFPKSSKITVDYDQ
ncbi:MAG: 2Fe-2S iron-sulfur cluster-binding protein [Saprospiraceae bacterium]